MTGLHLSHSPEDLRATLLNSSLQEGHAHTVVSWEDHTQQLMGTWAACTDTRCPEPLSLLGSHPPLSPANSSTAGNAHSSVCPLKAAVTRWKLLPQLCVSFTPRDSHRVRNTQAHVTMQTTGRQHGPRTPACGELPELQRRDTGSPGSPRSSLPQLDLRLLAPMTGRERITEAQPRASAPVSCPMRPSCTNTELCRGSIHTRLSLQKHLFFFVSKYKSKYINTEGKC